MDSNSGGPIFGGQIYYNTAHSFQAHAHSGPAVMNEHNMNIQSSSTREQMFVQDTMNKLKGEALRVVSQNDAKVNARATLLAELGFKGLAKHSSNIAARAMKENMIALSPEGYKKIPYAKFLEAVRTINNNTLRNVTLVCTSIEAYLGQNKSEEGSQTENESVSFPPTEALEKLAAAKKEGLFDEYAVLHVVRGPDPILVGKIQGSLDMYVICEWGDDISFEEIMK